MSDSFEKLPLYDSAKFLNLMSDPIKLAIIFELMRNPDITSLEIKKKLNIPGSRIYYYLNQLVDSRVIEESETEKVTKTLSRRKFKITDWFLDVFTALDKEFHDPLQGQRKTFHLFQLYFARMVLEQQVRVIEQIPEVEFDKFISSQNLPYQQFFFVNEDTLPFINQKHQEIGEILFQRYADYGSMIDIIRKTNYVTLSGTYLMD